MSAHHVFGAPWPAPRPSLPCPRSSSPFLRLTLVEDQPFDHMRSFVVHGFRGIQVVLG
ncbi:hypothetical protein [Streptomyces sp. NPDC091215]|uniref:hypothetical protein n=1 Tax=Streptomyces sp. NPDC091215 TaxID=3155192 RepID=UPI0034369E28